MKIFSRNSLILVSALVINGFATAAVQTHNQNKHNIASKAQTSKVISYTARGKTDARTARLFRQLLKNSKYLQVSATVNQARPAPRPGKDVDVAVNYTIKGTTSKRNVQKLISLFKNSRSVEVNVRANVANVKLKRALGNQTLSFNQPGSWKINRLNRPVHQGVQRIAGK